MTIQTMRAGPKLEFPAQGATGRQIDVPFTIHEFFPNRELAIHTNVCKAWQRFVYDVACCKSRNLAATGGVRLNPERYLRTTVESYTEIKEKIRQFCAHLDLSRVNEFICYRPDGRALLRIVSSPSDPMPDQIPDADTFVFDPASNDLGKTEYVVTCLPSATRLRTNGTSTSIAEDEGIDHQAMIAMPLIRKQVLGRYQQPYQCQLLIQGAFPLQQEEPILEPLHPFPAEREPAGESEQQYATLQTFIVLIQEKMRKRMQQGKTISATFASGGKRSGT